MSVMYCHECDTHVDTDYDVEHFGFYVKRPAKGPDYFCAVDMDEEELAARERGDELQEEQLPW